MAQAWVPAIVVACLAGAAALALPAVAQKRESLDIAKRVQNARDTVTSISDRLRNELVTAIKATGHVAAISYCQTISPDLTTRAADEFGFETLRIGVRLRNPENAPDEWERRVLELFQSRLASGADAAKLEHHEVVTTTEGEKMLRYMKPILMQEMCMGCHGTDVKQEVKAEIARYYPDDKAIGFRVGELRGAFSLAQIIEE